MTEPVDLARGALATTSPLDVGIPLSLGEQALRIDPAHAESRPTLRLAMFIEQLQTELDVREQQLSRQTEQFEAAQLAWRQQQAMQRDELRRGQCQLEEQRSTLQAHEQELLRQARLLVDAQCELATDRERLREDVLEELRVERDELIEWRAQLNTECVAIAEEKARLAGEEARIQERVERQLQSDRQMLWENLTQEWDDHRAVFDAERAAWEAQCEDVRQQIDAERSRYEGLVAAWEQELSRRHAELEDELNERREAAESEWVEIVAEREQSLAEQQTALQRERVLLENRLRFQQEHLEKARLDLERAQNEFRTERQRERQQIEDDARQLERRQVQLGAYRRTLDELVRAVDREHTTVLKCREAFAATTEGDRQSLEDERGQWEQDRQRQELELRHQQEMLHQQVERLEGRQLRLERLRAELEDTHRITLELRLAVEETWAQIAHTVGGDEEARVKVEQARQALVLYYQQLHITLEDHRRQLSEQQAWFDQQRAEFHDERQTVLHWLNERDERLRAEEARQIAAAAELGTHDADWRAAREQWLTERLEAERVIRRLVNELADGTLTAEPGALALPDSLITRAA